MFLIYNKFIENQYKLLKYKNIIIIFIIKNLYIIEIINIKKINNIEQNLIIFILWKIIINFYKIIIEIQ